MLPYITYMDPMGHGRPPTKIAKKSWGDEKSLDWIRRKPIFQPTLRAKAV